MVPADRYSHFNRRNGQARRASQQFSCVGLPKVSQVCRNDSITRLIARYLRFLKLGKRPTIALTPLYSLVVKVAVLGTLHDGLGARELYLGIEARRHVEIRAAHEQKSKLRLTKLPVEFGVTASRNIDLKHIFRLFDHMIVEGFFSSERCERGCHGASAFLSVFARRNSSP